MRNSLLTAVAAAALFTAASPALAKGGTWVAVALPNASATQLFAINDKNMLTGQYTDSSGNVHGFLANFKGTKVTNIDDPSGDTQPRDLNNLNWVTGFDAGAFAPWEVNKKGTLNAITKDGTDLDQVAQGINQKANFVGDYTNTQTNLYSGYIGKDAKWRKDIDLSSIQNGGYAGRAIDNAGDVAGWYYDPSTGLQRGYLLPAGSKTATLIDYPSATYTVVEGMNNNGIIVGQWEDSSGNIHGWYYTVSTGKFVSLDAPGATITQTWNINDNNVIAASTTTAGSFIYCMSTCPKEAAHVNNPPKYMAPARP
jgi:hypothetical protein